MSLKVTVGCDVSSDTLTVSPDTKDVLIIIDDKNGARTSVLLENTEKAQLIIDALSDWIAGKNRKEEKPMTCEKDRQRIEVGDIVHVRMEVTRGPEGPTQMPLVRLQGTQQHPFAVSMEKITQIERRPLQVGDWVVHIGSAGCRPGAVMGIGNDKAWVYWDAHGTDCVYPLEKLKRARS